MVLFPISLSSSLLSCHFTDSLTPCSIWGWELGDIFPALFIQLLHQSKEMPQCGMLVTPSTGLNMMRLCTLEDIAKLNPPLNTFHSEISRRKGLSLFSLSKLCASGWDIFSTHLSPARVSSFRCRDWKMGHFVTPSCHNGTNWSR